MKNILLTLLFCVCMVGVNAEIYTEYEFNASGDASAAVTLDNQASGMRYYIYSIVADSDVATATLTVQVADAAGVTTSYTTLSVLPQTNTSTYSYDYSNNGYPIFVGNANYRYKFVLTSTAANSLWVTYDKK